ncbi:MAG: tol-pal system protein YbgF [Nitrosomonadales bacterium]|nr:tol-pal system protein YbgF [Nitrosomonadales bacterium]
MRFWLLICLCVASSHAAAGLFADNDARKQVQQLEARVVKLEQALVAADADKEKYIRSILDLQIQMEGLSTDLRKLRGQNEELAHNLAEAEKRQKDFYIDLDTRVRRLEAGDSAASDRADARSGSANPANESRAFEAAYAFYKSENYANAATAFRDFLKSYPQSAHEPNVLYWMGNSNFLLKDCKSSVSNYQSLIEKYQDHPRAPEAMLNIADCQLTLKSNAAARKTLKQLISQFPGSDASEKAKKRLAAIK